LLAEPEDSELLAKILSGLLRSNQLREKLGLNGEKKAQTFTWDRHAELIEEMFIKMGK
jgi:glycosyltransferase involved in cell wall biosynthesis